MPVRHSRGRAWRRWQQRLRVARAYETHAHKSKLALPHVIDAQCGCDPMAPDSRHWHTWEDLFAARWRFARRRRDVRVACGCWRCQNARRAYGAITVQERRNLITTREQVFEERLPQGVIEVPNSATGKGSSRAYATIWLIVRIAGFSPWPVKPRRNRRKRGPGKGKPRSWKI